MIDHEDIAERILPTDGPHTADGVKAAAALMSALCNRLTYATLPYGATPALDEPSTLSDVVGSVKRMLEQLAQLLQQLGQATAGYDRARLRADAMAPAGVTPVEIAVAVQVDLHRAEDNVTQAAHRMRTAHNHAARLYLDDEA